MDREKFIPRLEETLEVIPGSLRDDDEVQNLEHWDSLKLLEILALVDEEFNVQLDANHLSECARVRDILALIDNSATGKEQ